jgi:hypothetical protein
LTGSVTFEIIQPRRQAGDAKMAARGHLGCKGQLVLLLSRAILPAQPDFSKIL